MFSPKIQVMLNSVTDDEVVRCLICKEPVNVTFRPCQHTVLCTRCFVRKRVCIRHCPYCGKEVKGGCKIDHRQSVQDSDCRFALEFNQGEVKWCIVCDQSLATITFRPCNHDVVCELCYKEKRLSFACCPTCGEDVQRADNTGFTDDDRFQVFFSNKNYMFVS